MRMRRLLKKGLTTAFAVSLLLCAIPAAAIEAGELYEGDGLFQGGSLEGPQRVDSSGRIRISARDTLCEAQSREDALYNDMLSAMTACVTESVSYTSYGRSYSGDGVHIDLAGRGYTRSNEDKTAVYMLYAQIVNANPQWFYYVPDVVFFRTGEELTSVYLLVNAAMYGRREDYEETIAYMMEDALPEAAGMSEAEKALALHDYIALHTRYDYAAWNEYIYYHYGDSHWLYANYSEAFSACGAVLDKLAVCHGMSLAYKDMLNRAGIQSYIEAAYNTGAGHAWNLVKIDDGWYHVDITTDEAFGGLSDPDGDMDLLGYVSHGSFLVSDAEYPRRDTSLPVAPVAHPASAFWSGAKSGMFRIGGGWYYSDAQYSDAQRYASGDLYKCAYGDTPRKMLSQASLPACAGGKLYYYSYADGVLYSLDPVTGEGNTLISGGSMPVGEMAFGAMAPGSAGRVDADILYIVAATYPAQSVQALYLGDGAKGDVDSDGKNTVWDILAILRGAHGTYTLNTSQRARADANCDLLVNEADAGLALRAIMQQ